MFRIRFHGRGGQGVKTASRVLGTAFFLEGFEVQDAPRYGAERRGAPIFAYVRASKQPINERGLIQRPDLVIVADDTLVTVPAAEVLSGITRRTVLLINSHESPETWRDRLNIESPIVILPVTEDVEGRAELPFIGAACAGAAACLVGIISRESLAQAIRDELATLGADIVCKNLEKAEASFQIMKEHAGCVTEGEEVSAEAYEPPDWVEVPFEDARKSAPVIHAGLTSVEVKTGLWRTMRPVIDYERCKRCWWVCSSFCPDSAILVSEEGVPEIDYDHCKGCMICVAQCPSHAIEAIPEHKAHSQEAEGGLTR
ncbi:MAG TPA: 2-oxoacid:acceptor oxidoreductase family protein [Thermodesulfobacteriota bacterium]|nr:2-oxoacid:acceptor oxidoreductase family protein [Thermodesulfobacteriota bacterium]